MDFSQNLRAEDSTCRMDFIKNIYIYYKTGNINKGEKEKMLSFTDSSFKKRNLFIIIIRFLKTVITKNF
jgi:hypothetical protein